MGVDLTTFGSVSGPQPNNAANTLAFCTGPITDILRS
jgi:hypothetical protein